MGEACSHIAAILFKIEAAVRLGLNDPACTSKTCVWNQHYRKKVEVTTAEAIDFSHPKHKSTPCKQRKRREPPEIPELAEVEQEQALQKLKKICPDAAALLKGDSSTDTASEGEESDALYPPVRMPHLLVHYRKVFTTLSFV